MVIRRVLGIIHEMAEPLKLTNAGKSNVFIIV